MKLEEEHKFAPPTPEGNQRGAEILARWGQFCARRIEAQELESWRLFMRLCSRAELHGEL